MEKIFLKNSALYMLTFSNLAYAIKHGFHWLSYLAIGLSFLTFILGCIGEVENNGK